MTASASTFTMSDRQAQALANMEAMLGLRCPRVEFADHEAFQAYWDQIARRCDSRTRTTPADRAAQQQRTQARITTHYQDAERLLTYGLTYAHRYQASLAKVRQQLMLKSANETLCAQVMGDLSERVNERDYALDLAERMQRQGRNAQTIHTKLLQRLFPVAIIAQCLEALAEATGSVLDAQVIARKVQQLQRKGLSRQAMTSKFRGNAADAAVIQAACATVLGDHGDEVALRLAYAKLARKNLDRRVLIQRLVSKGFRYGEVLKIISQSGPQFD